MGYRQHRREGPGAVPCAIITASDTRDESSDTSGAYIRRALLKAGHPVVDYRVLKDDPARIAAHLRALAARGDVRVVLINGGTGIAPRDRTYEAVASLLEKRLDGFGEIFRALGFEAIGPSAILSRAIAGTFGGMIIFSMPGSEDAVRLALRRLILPELTHVAGLLARSAE